MNLTVEKACNLYLRYVSLKKKPQSIRSIKSRIFNYILPYFKGLKIYEISPKKYLEWQEWILKKGFSYKYKKALHYTNVSLFNFLIRFYDVEKNVPSLVGNFQNDLPVDQKNSCVWDRKTFRKFIRKVNDKQYRLFFSFLYKTGVRQGEALALTWEDIDLEKRIVNIDKTISKEYINGKRIINSPKTKKSIRKIRIDRMLKWGLLSYKKYYIKKLNNFNPKMYVFGFSKPLSPTTIERKKNYYCDLAKVPRIRIHDFRHSHATYLISKGIPATVVADRLGHSDISTTLNVYSHVLNRDEKRVLKILNFL